MEQVIPDEPPDDLLAELVASLRTVHTEAIVLGGSAAEGAPTPYSDVDLAHIVDAEYDGPQKRFYYRGRLLVSVNARTLDWWRQAVTQPEQAVFVVSPMRRARILFERSDAFARWQAELAAFSWEPIQPAADRFAGATVAAQAETVHKILSALVRGKGMYEPTVMLTLELTHAMAVQRGVLVESSASYMDQVRAAVGDACAWSAYHRIASCQPAAGEPSPDLRQQARAAVKLYSETFRLIEGVMPPDRHRLAQATVAVVDEAATLISPSIRPSATAESRAAPEDLHAVPPAPLVVAAGQATCTALDIPANATVAADLVRWAAEQGADLLVLPELFLTGYELPAIVADPETYTLNPGDCRLDPLSAACAETRTAMVVGAPTRDPKDETLHISALVLGRDGHVAARYDKQHVDSSERRAGFSPGTDGCTVVLDGWRLGLGICWDSSFPEHARAAALDGCHAYLIGALFGGTRGAHKRATVCPARALDNSMYVAAANHIGPGGPFNGCGGSAVWSPDGVQFADAGSANPGLAIAHLDPKVLVRVRAEDFVLMDPSLDAVAGRRRSVVPD